MSTAELTQPKSLAQYAMVKNTWYVAGMSNEFEKNKLVGQVICKRPVVLWRANDGQVVAYDDRCAHKRFPLSKGRIMADGTLECAYHGLRYDMGGKCVMIPSHPTGPISPNAVIQPYPVIEQDGFVWIWPGDREKASLRKPPSLPEVGDDAYESIVLGPWEVPANYLLLIENLLDITHFYPLHDGNIGDAENSLTPVELEEGEVDGNRYAMTIRHRENYKQPPYFIDWFHHEVADRHHTHCMVSPAITRAVLRQAPVGQLEPREGQQEFPSKLRAEGIERGYILDHCHTPIDEKRHTWRVVITVPAHHMSKGDATVSTAKRVAEMFPVVANEDKWALELQQAMFEYPAEDYQEVFLKPDIAIRRARKIFADMIREEDGPQSPKLQAAE